MAILPSDLTVNVKKTSFANKTSNQNTNVQTSTKSGTKKATLAQRTTGGKLLQDRQLFLGDDHGVYRFFKDKPNEQLVVPAHEPGKNSVSSREQREEQLNRLTMLVKMRNLVNEILDQQKHISDDEIDDLDNPPWAKKQQDLHDVYDAFTSKFGPINKLSAYKAGLIDSDGKRATVYRRLNLRQFRKDIDSERVAAIEIFDPFSNTAEKAPIFYQRVMRPDNEKPKMDTLIGALNHCLSQKGAIDCEYIFDMLADQFDSQADIEQALLAQGLIFLDPKTQSYHSKDVYLSGDVRDKIKLAQKALDKGDERYKRNIDALAAVKPADIDLSDVSLHLGNHWIPAKIIKKYATDVLGLHNVSIDYVPDINHWFASADVDGSKMNAGSFDFATEFFDPLVLLQATLNGSDLSLRRRKDSAGNPIDAEIEKELGHKKCQAIQDHFVEWIHAQPDLKSQLERKYNDTFNAIVPFKASGDHLTLPGLSTAIDLYDHQKDFVWRAIQTGNVLGAMAVGGGKTNALISALKEMKRMGKIKKPIIVVPDNLRAQFSGDFMRAYPDANVQVMDDKYLTELDGEATDPLDKLRGFAALVAENDYDVVFMSQSSFDQFKAPVRDVAQGLIDDVRAAYAIRDNARYTIYGDDADKEIDKHIAVKQRALLTYLGYGDVIAADRPALWNRTCEPLIRKDAKDSAWDDLLSPLEDASVSVDALGVDYIGMDEGHAYKNLAVHSKERFLNKIGSSRANNLHEILTYLRTKNPSHHFTMMTATPISNALEEVYTLQRYFQPDLLQKLGLDSYDVWRAMFAKTENVFEAMPEGGSYRTADRSVEYQNLSDLIRMFHAFADVILDDDLDLKRPLKKNGGPQTVMVPRPAYLDDFFEDLAGRGADLRAGNARKITISGDDDSKSPATANDNAVSQGGAAENTEDPDNKAAPRTVSDNMLAVLNEARYATLHPALVGLDVDVDQTAGKIEMMVDNIATIYHENKDKPYVHPKTGDSDPVLGALQMVMCDLGVPKGEGEFSVYDEIKKQLVTKGVPADKIAFVHDAIDDDKKSRLFENARMGEVSVILGTTGKLGTGTNIQKRLLAIHNLDLPWRPDQWVQRNGRGDRPGNWNDEIMLFDYVMEGSADLYMAQLLERKARFINQIMAGNYDLRNFYEDDPTTVYFAAMKAAAANDPDVFELTLLEEEFEKIKHAKQLHDHEQQKLLFRQNTIDDSILNVKNLIDKSEKDSDAMTGLRSKYYPLSVAGQSYDTAEEAGQAVIETVRNLRSVARQHEGQKIKHDIGMLYGFPVSVAMTAIRKEAEDKDKSGSLSYDIAIRVKGSQTTWFDVPSADIVRKDDEVQLHKEFNRLRQDQGSDVQLSEDFALTQRHVDERFRNFVERFVAPYRDLKTTLKDAQKDLLSLQAEQELLSQRAGQPYDQQDAFDHMQKQLKQLKKQIVANKKKKASSPNQEGPMADRLEPGL